jgi:cytochrome c5
MILRRVSLASLLTAFFLATPVRAQDLPSGAGKEVVQKVCTACHTLDRLVGEHRTKDEWSDTVDKMAVRGAKASDEEFEMIVNYLAKYFGKDESKKSN